MKCFVFLIISNLHDGGVRYFWHFFIVNEPQSHEAKRLLLLSVLMCCPLHYCRTHNHVKLHPSGIAANLNYISLEATDTEKASHQCDRKD